ncbi:MAG: thioredoxin domain-containing protein, partial [Candidatus Limnocylindrales bacterium]
APYLVRYPTGFAQWLVAATFAAGHVVEVAVVGDPADAAMTTMLAPVWSTWRPNQVLAAAPADAVGGSAIPLLAGRVAIDGRPTAYVCRDFVCDLPVTDPAALEARL